MMMMKEGSGEEGKCARYGAKGCGPARPRDTPGILTHSSSSAANRITSYNKLFFENLDSGQSPIISGKYTSRKSMRLASLHHDTSSEMG